MNAQLVVALIGLLGAFGGIATGIVALRRVGTENVVSVRTVANTEADTTMKNMREFNDTLQKAYDARGIELDRVRDELVDAWKMINANDRRP